LDRATPRSSRRSSLLARFTGRSIFFSASRQVLIAAVAASVTYGIGVLLGT